MTLSLRTPTLVITDCTDEHPFGFGLPELLDPDGNRIDWPTVGEWRVEFGDELLTTLHVAFPVRVRVVPPKGKA